MLINKIMIIAPSWVGDLIMAQALFKLLKKQNKNAILDIYASEKFFPLLQRMPEVDRCFSFPFGHGELNLIKRYKFAQTLKIENYDQAIVLPNSFKSALIPFWAGIKLRTAWRGEMRYGLINDLRILNKEQMPLLVQRYAALALEKNAELPKNLVMPELVADKKLLAETLKNVDLGNAHIAQGWIEKLIAPTRILAICPGAEYGSAKRWPAEYFAKIAQIKAEEGWQIWIFGAAKDASVAAEIQDKCGGICVDLTGKTDIGQAVDLLLLAKVVISNDSGLMHIAAALGKSLIALYGSSSSTYTPPLSEKAKILSLHLSCSPCFKRECPFGHKKCLVDLTPEMVLEQLMNDE